MKKNNNEKNFVYCLINEKYDIAYKLLCEIAFIYDDMEEIDFCMEVEYVFDVLLENNRRVDKFKSMNELRAINQTKLG